LLTLATAFEKEIQAGAPLPEAYPTLTKAQIRFRASTVVMVAGVAGSNKSTLALNLAVRMDVPTLYYSADTDDFTVSLRLAALKSGRAWQDIEQELKIPDAREFYTDLLAETGNLWWSFEPEPSPEQMDTQLSAFVELFGDYPSLIVVDNLMNVSFDSENEWAGMRKLMKLFSFWARTTGACVLVLHHCAEVDYDRRFCPPRRMIQGKLSHYPALVLTLDVDMDLLKVACVKNRHGKGDASGELFETLRLDAATMRVTDFREVT
jgi:hypothetical protein